MGIHMTGANRSRHGFTLVELMVTIVIIGIITAIAVPIYLNQRREAWKATVVSDVHNTATSVERILNADDATDATPSAYMIPSSASAMGVGVGAPYIAESADDPAPAIETAAASTVFNRTYDASNGALAQSSKSIDGHADAVVVSVGDSVNVLMREDGSYTITGANRNVPGWVYTYDSSGGSGTWTTGTVPGGSTTNPSTTTVGECAISYDSATATMDVGTDGGHCVVSIDHSSEWQGVKTINLHGWVTFSGAGTVFNARSDSATMRKSLSSVPYLDGQKVDFAAGYDASDMLANTPLYTATSLQHWDTSNIVDMHRMLYGAASFNQDIGTWTTSSVTDMSGMFQYASSFNKSLNSWNTARVTDMSYMFYNATAFNGQIGGWNTSAVQSMDHMLYNALVFNQPVGSWNVANVTDMNHLFYCNYKFNQSLSGWNTAKATNMEAMFGYDSVFNQNLAAWNTASVTDMINMFYSAAAFNQNLSGWNVAKVVSHDSFSDKSAMTAANLPKWKA